jgi:hypothetical protein
MFYALALDDLVEPGIVEVSASGVTAARLLLVTGNSRYSLINAGHDDMVVVQRTPGHDRAHYRDTAGTPHPRSQSRHPERFPPGGLLTMSS